MVKAQEALGGACSDEFMPKKQHILVSVTGREHAALRCAALCCFARHGHVCDFFLIPTNVRS